MFKNRKYLTGILAFMMVLMIIPLGHTLMILTEKLFPEYKFKAAISMGIVGVVLLFTGLKFHKKQLLSTLLGFGAGILVWTGWVEFSFVWIAEKLSIDPLVENNEVTTKSEYLLMLSSAGLLMCFMVFLLFSSTSCNLFRYFQKHLGLKTLFQSEVRRPVVVIAFFETIMIIWTFYILLLFIYDEDIAGTYHPATYIVAFGSLLWSLYLFRNLLGISKMDYAVRYAIPTVVIFWNFVEIMGRWNLLNEIWIDPFGHTLENLIILFVFLTFLVSIFFMKPIKRV